mgnify:CR=1 FL=1
MATTSTSSLKTVDPKKKTDEEIIEKAIAILDPNKITFLLQLVREKSLILKLKDRWKQMQQMITDYMKKSEAYSQVLSNFKEYIMTLQQDSIYTIEQLQKILEKLNSQKSLIVGKEEITINKPLDNLIQLAQAYKDMLQENNRKFDTAEFTVEKVSSLSRLALDSKKIHEEIDFIDKFGQNKPLEKLHILFTEKVGELKNELDRVTKERDKIAEELEKMQKESLIVADIIEGTIEELFDNTFKELGEARK